MSIIKQIIYLIDLDVPLLTLEKQEQLCRALCIAEGEIIVIKETGKAHEDFLRYFLNIDRNTYYIIIVASLCCFDRNGKERIDKLDKLPSNTFIKSFIDGCEMKYPTTPQEELLLTTFSGLARIILERWRLLY